MEIEKNQIPFIGPSYQLRSVNVDCQRTVNLYPTPAESGVSKSQNGLYLQSTPGIKNFLVLNDVEESSPIRALGKTKNNLLIIVVEDKVIFYNDITDEQSIVGLLNTTEGNVEMADNGFQIGFVDGDYYYVYDYEEGTFSDYSELEGWLGSNHIFYFQTYFIFIERNSQKFFISRPYDATTLNPLDFASAEASPDNIVGGLVCGQIMLFFGGETVELYVNTGDATFPIEKQSAGATIDIGCIAPFSICLLENNPIWIGKNKDGYGTVYYGLGEPQKVSNLAVDYAIQNMESIEDCYCYTYQQEGHYFYVMNFLGSNTTWVWDKTTNMWHERQYLNPNNGIMERQRGQKHILFRNKHLVSDYANSNLYELSLNEYTDNGNPIKRMRISPHLFSPSLTNMRYNMFQLDLDVGSNYEILDKELPKINLRYSNDGGKTWSNYDTINLWEKGDYKKRVIWRKLGMARDRVFEVTVSDPVKITMLGAYIGVS